MNDGTEGTVVQMEDGHTAIIQGAVSLAGLQVSQYEMWVSQDESQSK